MKLLYACLLAIVFLGSGLPGPGLLAAEAVRADQILWMRHDGLTEETVSLFLDDHNRLMCGNCSPGPGTGDPRSYAIKDLAGLGADIVGLTPWMSTLWTVLLTSTGGSHCAGSWYVVNLLDHSLQKIKTKDCLAYEPSMAYDAKGHGGSIITLTDPQGHKIVHRSP